MVIYTYHINSVDRWVQRVHNRAFTGNGVPVQTMTDGLCLNSNRKRLQCILWSSVIHVIICIEVITQYQIYFYEIWMQMYILHLKTLLRYSGPDSRNDPLAIGSNTILWSCSADRIPQTPITIGSSDRENTKPNSLLAIESWFKSFTGKYKTEITRSRLNEKHHYFYSWSHNGRCGNIIYVCRYESVMTSSVHTHGVVHETTRVGHAMFDRYVYVINVIEYIQTFNTRQNIF